MRQTIKQKTVGLILGISAALAVSWANPFATVKYPSNDRQEVVGSYANGCIFGASQINDRGIGYQVMRQSRNRYYGHQVLIDYVEQLAIKRDRYGELLLIGDLGQPRGGRMPSDHASHQMGLDVDIWLYPMTQKTFKHDYIEKLTMRSVVDRGKGELNQYWDPTYFDLIADAANIENVDRIFINPVIKKELCQMDENAPWQYKVRPWFGHDSHFHVRLKCPEGSPDCITQAPIPKVSGCNADLDNWIRDQSNYTLNPKPATSSSTPKPKPVLPQRCYQLVN